MFLPIACTVRYHGLNSRSYESTLFFPLDRDAVIQALYVSPAAVRVRRSLRKTDLIQASLGSNTSPRPFSLGRAYPSGT
jgi:hypothetical protein